MDTMKRIIIIATAFVALYACSEKINVPGLSQTEDAIVFSARSSDTRTVVGTNMDRLLTVAWADEDAVGIYGFQTDSLLVIMFSILLFQHPVMPQNAHFVLLTRRPFFDGAMV